MLNLSLPQPTKQQNITHMLVNKFL